MRYRRVAFRPRCHVAWLLAPVALIVAAVGCDHQVPAGVDDVAPQPRFAKKPPADPIEVDDFDPKEGVQAQTFPMTVMGSGFGNRAKVVFVLDGEDVSTIETTTTAVNAAGTELTADVTIGLETVAREDYKVAVQLRRSRGVGTESFKVKEVGQAPVDIPVSVELRDGPDDGFTSDGGGQACPNGGDTPCPYVDSVEDVEAVIYENNAGGDGDLYVNVWHGGRMFLFDMAIVGGLSDTYSPPAVCTTKRCTGTADVVRTLLSDNEEGLWGLTPAAPGDLTTLRIGWTEAEITWWIYFGDSGGKKSVCSTGEQGQQNRVQVTATTFGVQGPTGWVVRSRGDATGGNAVLCRFAPNEPGRPTLKKVADLYGPFELTVTRLP